MVHLQVAVVVRLPDLPQQLLQLLDLHLARLLQILVQQRGLHLLALPPQVGRQLEAVHHAPAVPDDDDGVALVERDVVELGLLLGHDRLHADGVVFVDVEIVDVNLAVDSDRRKHGGAVGRPGHVTHLGVQVEHEQRLAANNNFQLH